MHLDAGQTEQVTMAMPPGLPYEKEIQGGRLWHASISSSSGFTPIFYDAGTTDLKVVSNNCGVDDWGLGLLLYARDNIRPAHRGHSLGGNAKSVFERMRSWFQGNF